MWWQATLVMLAVAQAEPKQLSPEEASDMYSLMERLREERLDRLNVLVKNLKQNSRLPQDVEELKVYRSELKRLSQKDEPYFPMIETPVKLGDFGYVLYPYRVLSIVGPNDVVVHRPDPVARDPIAWLTDYDTSQLQDDQLLPLERQVFYVTETRSYIQVGGGKRTVPVLRPVSAEELKKTWTERRKQDKKKQKK